MSDAHFWNTAGLCLLKIRFKLFSIFIQNKMFVKINIYCIYCIVLNNSSVLRTKIRSNLNQKLRIWDYKDPLVYSSIQCCKNRTKETKLLKFFNIIQTRTKMLRVIMLTALIAELLWNRAPMANTRNKYA